MHKLEKMQDSPHNNPYLAQLFTVMHLQFGRSIYIYIFLLAYPSACLL